MIRVEDQKKEIETIKERSLKLMLSDADVIRVTNLAESHGLSVSSLIENFIGDLVCGTYSNGSDERDFAGRWFDRCWFGMFPEETFVKHLIDWGEIEYFVEDLEYLDEALEDLKDVEDQDDRDAIEEEIERIKDELYDYYEGYKKHAKDPVDYEKGVEAVRKYRERLAVFMGGDN